MPKVAVLAALAAILGNPVSAAQPKTGFLVIAPDRGFLGNEEVRDAFAEYRKGFNAALAIADREDFHRFLDEALKELKGSGTHEVVALPLFLSARDPRLKKTATALARTGLAIRMAQPLAGHPLFSELLAERAAASSREPRRERLIVVAQGAEREEDAAAMQKDLDLAAEGVLRRYPFAGLRSVVLANAEELRDYTPASWKRLKSALQEARAAGLKPVLVLFDLAPKLDSMMSLNFELSELAGRFGAAYDGTDLASGPGLELWLAGESGKPAPIDEKSLGVVLMAHGASERWNRLMLDSLKPLASRYMIEPAFGMADPAALKRSVRKLESRGARAIVAVRVFSLEESFRAQTEYELGLKAGGHHHEGHGMSMPRPIRSRCPILTLGGLEDSPLFAEALFDRAMALSKDPKRETVFLLAHGEGDDRENEHWLKVLASLATQIQELARRRGAPFRDVRYGTWREDWPDKRAEAVKKIRAEIQEASATGTAIVVPARTALGGPERELLKGLSYAYDGQSFAPHPKFVQWVESQIQAALRRFNSPPNDTPACALSHRAL